MSTTDLAAAQFDEADRPDGGVGGWTDAERLALAQVWRRRPEGKVVMYQRWRRLLFLHWRVEAEALRARLPEGLYLDTFGGEAWVGVVPFWMDRVRPRFCPAVPGLSWFLELNLRTYVHDEAGVPGVWFFSLDCNQSIAVKLARSLFSLPYVHARQRGEAPGWGEAGGEARFESERCDGEAKAERSGFTYGAEGEAFVAEPGTLEFFLAERYVLYSRSARTGRLYRGRVWHRPYPLRRARVERAETGLFLANGLEAPGRGADHALVSDGVDVSIYPLQRVGRGAK